MSNTRIYYLAFFIGVVLPLVAFPIAVLLAAGGHGSYAPGRVLFPFTMLSTVFNDRITIEFLYMGLAQFPLYAVVVAVFCKIDKAWWGFLGVAMLHLIAAVAAFSFTTPGFPNWP